MLVRFAMEQSAAHHSVQEIEPVNHGAVLERLPSCEEPDPLPLCTYPNASDVARHGIQDLPEYLPLIDLEHTRRHRSRQFTTVPAAHLTSAQVLRMVQVVGTSFARREPQARHLQPPTHPPSGLMDVRHRDPFGSAPFGDWDAETLLSWFIRLVILTDPASPRSHVEINAEAMSQSLAIVDRTGEVIGGAFNETMPALDGPSGLRGDDAFLTAALSFVAPVLELLAAQDAEALKALCTVYPAFREAYARRKVGHHFMVARSDSLPKADTFELVAATAERYQALGHEFLVIEATNQWTGAACEVLGGVRVHFAPYRARRTVRESPLPRADAVTSPDGFLSKKDSGSMFYVIRLR
jgi:hypothetical protein